MLDSFRARNSCDRNGDEGEAVNKDSRSVESDTGNGSGPVKVIFCFGGSGMDAAEDDSASDSESDSGAAALPVFAERSPKKLRDDGRAVVVSLALPLPLAFLSFFCDGQTSRYARSSITYLEQFKVLLESRLVELCARRQQAERRGHGVAVSVEEVEEPVNNRNCTPRVMSTFADPPWEGCHH